LLRASSALYGASRTRTGDLLGAIQALSQLSYSPAAAQCSLGTLKQPFTRRQLLQGAAATAAAGTLSPAAFGAEEKFDPRSWASVRAQFALNPRETNFATFLLASHPKPVRDAIARYARALDGDAKRYLDTQEDRNAADERVRAAAARYLGVASGELALTDSTTMGLGLLYGGLQLAEDDEVVATTHDFYSTHESLRLRALRTGTHVRRIRLYANARTASVDEIVSSVRRAITPKTRALAVTWVHSSTGVKLPIRAIADALPPRVLLCVDGVHGFGAEASTPRELGCDFLVSGCHKWLLGPRGTGVIWGRADAWNAVTPTIPTFDGRAFGPWLQGEPPPPSGIPGLPRAAAMTPGGFHSFEHRWALREAFEFRRRIGRARAAARTHALAQRLKNGLAEVKGVRLVTPQSSALSAGLVCFELEGREPFEVVDRLYARARIVASVTPYAARYVRLGPTILNTPSEIDRVVRAIASA
jgi:selenocysteine lyase/cysteine desulfurase